MADSNGTLLIAFRIFLFCALASAVTTLLPLVTRPCASSLSRTILAATGLDPYLISCADADDGSKSNAELSEGDGGNKPGTGGSPIVIDLQSCGEPDLPSHALPPFRCCPPTPASDAPITNFTFPDPGETLRTRRPAHEPGTDSVAQYARAVALMKALPESDPRSFYQQANIHCAYCSAAYRQAGRPVQVHFSWLFFPFHRAYLYFFERIAARLLGEPGFALPFWSWDVPEGMRVPPEFADVASPLYDPMRNPKHAPPRLMDLDFPFSSVEKNCTDEQQIQLNLHIMYKQMVTNAPLPSLFLGQPYRAGDRGMPGAGTVELNLHNVIHWWSGDPSQANHENMGAFYSSGRDPIFYPHHANNDRLWEVWRSGGGHADFTDPDWLDSSFLFYDEDARLVRVTVRDMLDVGRLRYEYADVGLPWLSARPPVTPGDMNRGRGLPHLKSVRFPVSLDATVTAEVSRRPGKPRSRWEEEVLVVEGIETDGTGFVKFDVYVNAADHEKVGPGGREMAGSFVSLKHSGNVVVQTSMRVALSEILEDLGAEGDDSVTVKLVPVEGRVRIGGLKIVHMAE